MVETVVLLLIDCSKLREEWRRMEEAMERCLLAPVFLPTSLRYGFVILCLSAVVFCYASRQY